jgi:O-acetyl-ADP-ribose deacetylase
MTQWHVAQLDILDAEADGLICSANPSLNLSGGVGGAFLVRYGDAMQRYLHDYLRQNHLRFIEPWQAVVAPQCDSRFLAVAHAVAIDAFYDTDVVTILSAYEDALRQLAALRCRTVAAAWLACGYGRVSHLDFAEIAADLATRCYDGITDVTLVTTNADLVDAIDRVLVRADD